MGTTVTCVELDAGSISGVIGDWVLFCEMSGASRADDDKISSRT